MSDVELEKSEEKAANEEEMVFVSPKISLYSRANAMELGALKTMFECFDALEEQKLREKGKDVSRFMKPKNFDFMAAWLEEEENKKRKSKNYKQELERLLREAVKKQNEILKELERTREEDKARIDTLTAGLNICREAIKELKSRQGIDS